MHGVGQGECTRVQRDAQEAEGGSERMHESAKGCTVGTVWARDCVSVREHRLGGCKVTYERCGIG